MKTILPIIFSALFFFIIIAANAQNYYYVFLTDKKEVKINPHDFFDHKAIERRLKCGLDLFDESDLPVNENYKNQLELLADDYVGESRWFNMIMMSASDNNINIVKSLPFVKNVVLLKNNSSLELTKYDEKSSSGNTINNSSNSEDFLSDQLKRMGGEYFINNNINGKGVRVAIFDGGFVNVNKHIAFQHLIKNGQIIKTWNFPLKKENVYGWNQHGTMVLSCIAGIKYSEENNKEITTLLGLATGAEFLLARTEVNSEPAKEEFWWLQAVEWADQNGADIINSSLGYGIQRYSYKDMDGSSLVAKAANMAAKKGMLVCNSAGNEGSDKNWMKLITPADADSVLTIGGITNQLNDYRRISFSSYGPTADGRKKPNLVNFGEAQVANPRSTDKYESVFGTSFSSPLTAGFAACALQTNPKLTAMELKTEMEKSGDLFPYFDYAFGHGVPQAKYFTEKSSAISTTASFSVEEFIDNNDINGNKEQIKITILNYPDNKNENYLWYNIQNEDGTLKYYAQIKIKNNTNNISDTSAKQEILIDKSDFNGNKTLNIFYNNYFQSYKPKKTNNNIENSFLSDIKSANNYAVLSVNVKNQEEKISKWGNFSKHYMTGYFSWSMYIPTTFMEKNYSVKYGKSIDYNFGFRYKYNICSWYSIGTNLEIGGQSFSLTKERLDFSPADIPPYDSKIEKNKFVTFRTNLELYQRFNFLKGGTGCLFLDLGIYGGVSSWGKVKQEIKFEASKISLSKEQKLNNELFDYGVRARFGYSWFALYAQYKIANNYYNKDYFFIALPKLSVGFELSIPIP